MGVRWVRLILFKFFAGSESAAGISENESKSQRAVTFLTHWGHYLLLIYTWYHFVDLSGSIFVLDYLSRYVSVWPQESTGSCVG